MERRAAVDYLLKIAEKSNNSKFSAIVNDLARRVALSIEQNDVNLDKFCSKMAAELLFRDDYVNANKLMKVANDASMLNNDLLPVSDEDEESKTEIVPGPQEPNETFIQQNTLKPKENVIPDSNPQELTDFLKRLTNLNVDVTTIEEQNAKDQDDSKRNQDQVVEDLNQPQTEQESSSVS